MGDSIEYCEQCDNRVGCHLERQCFRVNDKANGPLDTAACSVFAWESMTNGGKLLLLTYALMAVVARTWTETWRQADWPHELSLSTERDAFRRLTDKQNAKSAGTDASEKNL